MNKIVTKQIAAFVLLLLSANTSWRRKEEEKRAYDTSPSMIALFDKQISLKRIDSDYFLASCLLKDQSKIDIQFDEQN